MELEAEPFDIPPICDARLVFRTKFLHQPGISSFLLQTGAMIRTLRTSGRSK